MTVIAWDGHVLAADKQATYGDTKRTTTKIFRVNDSEVIALCGSIGAALVLLDWYKSGAQKESWPQQLQDSDDWAQLIIAAANGVRFYDRRPYFQMLEDPFMAWGLGNEFALGALSMGASAIQAVEIASKWCEGCGMGVDYFQVGE